jgi:hypothetical protein
VGLPIAEIHDTVSVAEEKMPEQAPASDWQAACEARLRSARLEPSWHHPSRRMEDPVSRWRQMCARRDSTGAQPRPESYRGYDQLVHSVPVDPGVRVIVLPVEPVVLE